MTHCFHFKYHEQKYHFIWDNESGSLHNVDYVAFLIAKNKYAQATMTQSEIDDYLAIDKSLVVEIESELGELESLGQLNTPCDIKTTAKRIGEIKALCLHICHDCNLRCRYCFASDGTYNTTDKAYMSAEVGKKAIDYLIKHSGSRHNLEVDFFGGEPLMNLDVVKQIVDYARSLEEKFNKEFSFTMTTNCVLLNKETNDWLNKEMVNVVLSIDGRKDIHEEVRRTPNGKGCYDTILSNALAFRSIRGDKSYYVRGTFTAKNLDFAKDILALNDCGFDQISMEPVVTDIDDLAIKQEHIARVLEEYEVLASEYIDRRKTNKWFNFFHFMIDLEGGPCITKRLTGCGSGCEYLSVVPHGNVYPCHQFSEKNEYLMGNVFDGSLNLEVSKIFAKNIVTNKTDCQECPAKYYCSGGCVANNLNFAGSMDKPHDLSCQMMKKRLELSLAISAIESVGV